MNVKKLDQKFLIALAIFMLIDPIVINWLFKIHFFSPFVKSTNYLLQSTLLAGIINIFIVSIIVFYFGKLDLKSIWLTPNDIKIALFPLALIWVISNLAVILFGFLASGQILFIDRFNFFIGRFAGQIFGNAPFEEIVFRGVFFVQLYLLFKLKTSNNKAIILAVIFSEIFFATVHIPNRIWINKVDNLLFETLGLFIAGIFLNLIFIYTRNLAYLIGIHAMANFPVIFFKAPSQTTYYTTYVLILVVTLLWKKLVPARQEIKISDFSLNNGND